MSEGDARKLLNIFELIINYENTYQVNIDDSLVNKYAHVYQNNFIEQEFLPKELIGEKFFDSENNSRENLMREFLRNFGKINMNIEKANYVYNTQAKRLAKPIATNFWILNLCPSELSKSIVVEI